MLRATTLALFVLVGAGAVARAEIESDRVRAALAAFRALKYERALSLLDQAAATESLTRDEKIAVYRTAGFCHVALDRPDEARRDFVRLLTIAPETELDDRVSPRVRAVFEDARSEVALRGAEPRSAHHLPELLPTRDPVAPKDGQREAVTVCHPGGMARRGRLFHRVPDEGGGYSRIEATVDDAGCVAFVIPGTAVRAPALELYVDVFDDAGAVIARAGSLGAPLSVAVRPRPVPLVKRRWFWGVIGGAGGALVLTGVVLAVTLTTPSNITVLPR